MFVQNLNASLQRAHARLGNEHGRRVRSDKGKSRLSPAVQRFLTEGFSTQERPRFQSLLQALREFCEDRDITVPSRASVYAFRDMANVPAYSGPGLPESVRSALYNLDPQARIPGPQVAFHCYNYGDSAAMSFASGLPWLVLYQAARIPGYRPKSLGLLRAVLYYRNIEKS